jgi:anaerobic glycerol-3-phosphate dehydrogenase
MSFAQDMKDFLSAAQTTSKMVDDHAYNQIKSKYTDAMTKQVEANTPDDEDDALDKAQKQLNSVLLSHLNGANAESMSTEHGTAYKSEKKSASIADPQAFMDFVIANAAWDLLDREVNVTATEEFVKSHNAPPPGVNYSSTFVAGVRRA